MIKTLEFKTYKSYKDWQKLELKPLTILFGKNSSGKSALARLPTLIEESLKGNFPEPIQFNNNGVEIGAEFRDLVYGRREAEVLEFILKAGNQNLSVNIAANIGSNNTPKIINWKLDNVFDLSYNDIDKSYLNEINNEEYICEFNGFRLDLINYKNKEGSESLPDLSNFSLKTSYFGPFREIPQRSYTISKFDKPELFGVKGENAYLYLIKDYQTKEQYLIKNVSDWFKNNFEGWGIEVQKDIQQPNYYISLSKDNPKISINITNVGEGMSQVLPLVVRAYFKADKPTTIIMEQPELHLHPGAHGNLAELFVDSIKNDKNKRYLIETHSQNFILRIRRLIAEGKFNKDDLALYWINFDEEKNVSNMREINVDGFGKVDFWPENIFSESLDESIALRTAQIKKNNAN